LKQDERYKILCSKSELEKNIGKLIPLPPLYKSIEFRLPKGFEDTTSWSSFLLSEGRYKILKEMMDLVDGTTKLVGAAGIVPSGPHGMGKSALGLLIAIYAFMNEQILIYIPSCMEWLEGDEKQMAKHFLKHFRVLNADLASNIKSSESKRTLFDIVNSSNYETSLRDMSEVMTTLKSYRKSAVFYIFDEHNELFREIMGGKPILYRYPDFLGHFNKWTGLTRGARTITIYIGSAHSKFEFNLPAGESWRMRYLQPLLKEEAALLISTQNTDFSLPENIYKTDGKVDDLKMEKLKHYTGFLPREIKFFKNAECKWERYEKSRIEEFKRMANAVYYGASESQKKGI